MPNKHKKTKIWYVWACTHAQWERAWESLVPVLTLCCQTPAPAAKQQGRILTKPPPEKFSVWEPLWDASRLGLVAASDISVGFRPYRITWQRCHFEISNFPYAWNREHREHFQISIAFRKFHMLLYNYTIPSMLNKVSVGAFKIYHLYNLFLFSYYGDGKGKST